MTLSELDDLICYAQTLKAETQTLELKAAAKGCPSRLYDTISGFSNQDEGGVILFGVDEQNEFKPVGVYNAQDLMKHVMEQCEQMTPVVRPVFTTLTKDGKAFVSAEIPGIDVSDRPCFYAGKGRLKGSYVRVGDADKPMTEYEVYSYEAFRRKHQDAIRVVNSSSTHILDRDSLDFFLTIQKNEKVHLSGLKKDDICELLGLTQNGIPTLTSVLLFGRFPQGCFPQLCITATSVPGTEIGVLGPERERFLDNRRIEGTIVQMLNESLSFVRKNMHIKTIIDPKTGMRADREDYPLTAVREAILNALIHRDYSIHTEGTPIELSLFEDRFEVRSPGGLYGRLTVDELGKVHPDIRNPVLVAAMDVLGETENRYSGIPTMRRELKLAGMAEPEFTEERGFFIVRFRKSKRTPNLESGVLCRGDTSQQSVLRFCSVPRTRQEIADFLGVKSVSYAIKSYITPLVEKGLIALSMPDKIRSAKQKYITIHPA